MSSPPPELAWIGIVGGIAGIITSIVSLATMLRNRRRVDFQVISATRYSKPWQQWELDATPDWAGMPGARPFMKAGQSRRAFIVLEFAVTNEYPVELSVGRFVIDGWMFADKFTPHMYSYVRDYRVFDLYTQEPTGLDAYRKVSAKGSYGLRVEISEEAEGPAWRSRKSRYVVDLPEEYVVEF